MRKQIRAGLVGLLVFCACGGGGPATPKLSKVENSDGSSQIMTFAADKLSSAKSVDKDGNVTENTYQYTDDRITQVTRKSGDTTVTTTNVYKDKALSLSTTKSSGTIGSLEFSVTVTTNFTYAEGKLSKQDKGTVTTLKEPATNTTTEIKSSTTTDYTYNTSGLLQRETETKKSKNVAGNDVTEIAITEFAYDSANKLVSATSTADSTTNVATMAYDTSGRLSKITTANGSATIEYTDNKVSKVISQSGSNTVTSTYTYDVGNVTGLVPTLSNVFDLAGMIIPMTNTVPFDWMVM
ncbi:MAG: hypothetical protein QM765_07465 [Myxococcales bacterium]